MLKDITIGQYYPGQTVLHRLDPRVTLAGAILYIVCVFLFHGIIGFLFLAAATVLLMGISGVPARRYLRGIRAIWPLIAITAGCNLVFSQGGTAVWQFGILRITPLSIHNSVFYSIRLVLLVVGTSVMTLTTSPNKLTDGMEAGLHGFAALGAPIHEIAMMMSIALRFIPILGDEAEKIKKAQLARCADFQEGNLIRRARGMLPILVPLFVSAFQRAQDLSRAMEARCYHGGTGRTKLHPLQYARRDYIGYGCILAALGVMIALRIRDLPFPV